MSKEKTLRTLEETEVMQTAGIPAQETDGAGRILRKNVTICRKILIYVQDWQIDICIARELLSVR